MSNPLVNPNDRLKHYLDTATQELRDFLTANVVSNSTHELDRMQEYHLYWKFYDGQHYRDFNHTMLSFNYVKAFIDKIIAFLMGSDGISFKVTSTYNDNLEDELTKPVEEIILRQWRLNNKAITTHEILQMGSVCGDVWVMPTWLTDEKYLKINILDSRQCFPVFKDGNFNDMEGFQVRQTLTTDSQLTGNNEYRLKVTYYTKNYIETWYQKSSGIIKPKPNIFEDNKFDNDVNDYTKTENPLGFIPIVHIKNRPNSNSYFGKSDAHDIMKLNKVYNEMSQELKGIIDYYATPTTVVTGATLKNMKRGLGNVWSGLPPEANVFTLGLDADISSIVQFLQSVKVGMHEISDVPENVLGKVQAISGTSAAALQLTYLPLVQQADLKAITYGEGFTKLNRMILKMLNIYDKDNKRLKSINNLSDYIETGDLQVEPVFNYGFPSDRMQTLQEAQIEFQLGLTDRATVMNELGVNNVPDAIKKIDQEKIDMAQRDGMINNLIMGVGGQSTQEQQPSNQ